MYALNVDMILPLLQVLFLILKLLGLIDWDWAAVLIPSLAQTIYDGLLLQNTAFINVIQIELEGEDEEKDESKKD